MSWYELRFLFRARKAYGGESFLLHPKFHAVCADVRYHWLTVDGKELLYAAFRLITVIAEVIDGNLPCPKIYSRHLVLADQLLRARYDRNTIRKHEGFEFFIRPNTGTESAIDDTSIMLPRHLLVEYVRTAAGRRWIHAIHEVIERNVSPVVLHECIVRICRDRLRRKREDTQYKKGYQCKTKLHVPSPWVLVVVMIVKERIPPSCRVLCRLSIPLS